jgi:tetrahydromethanopterin S-methyltransferase subunit G
MESRLEGLIRKEEEEEEEEKERRGRGGRRIRRTVLIDYGSVVLLLCWVTNRSRLIGFKLR